MGTSVSPCAAGGAPPMHSHSGAARGGSLYVFGGAGDGGRGLHSFTSQLNMSAF